MTAHADHAPYHSPMTCPCGSSPDAAVWRPEPEVLAVYPICTACVAGEGSECHTPGCSFWMHDVPADGLTTEMGELVVDHAAEVTAAREQGQNEGVTEERDRIVARLEDEATVERAARLIDPIPWTEPVRYFGVNATSGQARRDARRLVASGTASMILAALRDLIAGDRATT